MRQRIVMTALLLPLLNGCSTLWHGTNVQTRQGESSSLVDFLYPDGEVPPGVTAKPVVQLPAKVGIAFVPSRGTSRLSGAEREALLVRVAEAFEGRQFVESITPIPEHYLVSARGIQGMRQVARLFDVNVMALVSYDQLSIESERDSALLYWTVIGSLVVKGNSNEVHTMIDTAVFDVPSGELLFRAPGLFENKMNATLVDAAPRFREQRAAGFSEATDDMIGNLELELDQLRAAVKAGRGPAVSWKGGGGSMGLWCLSILLGWAVHRRRRPASREFGLDQRVAASRLG